MKSSRLALIPLAFLVFFCIFQKDLAAAPREQILLDGEWKFATDPKSVGEKEEWFRANVAFPTMHLEGYSPKANGRIRVPGNWNQQGYGTPNKKVAHHYIGKGWYQRTITVPENWRNERTFLVLEGIMRYAKVWIDGKSIGEEAIGCIGPHEWNVSSFLKPGQTATITILVDSRQRFAIDPLRGSATFCDFIEDCAWGGLWGHVILESRPNIGIDSYYLRSNIHYQFCTCEMELDGAFKPEEKPRFLLEVLDASGKLVAQGEENRLIVKRKNGRVAMKAIATIPEMKLWTPESPYLYTIRLSLFNGDECLDRRECRYGMREIITLKSKLLLNGKPYYLLGCGDDQIMPIEVAMPLDKEFYRSRLSLMKKYGYNHIRNHSSILPREYYEVCDELGMLVTAEFLIGYWWDLPGEGLSWLRKVPKNTDPESCLRLYRDRWNSVVLNYRNHPSILCWVMGNELWEGRSIRLDFKETAQTLDPDRLFCDTDGDYQKYLFQFDRDTTDIQMMLFDVHGSPIVPNCKKYATPPLNKPTLSHEEGNYVTFADPRRYDRFKDHFKPYWMDQSIERLRELGLLEEASQWAVASEKLYLLHYKYGLENIRKNPELSGYHHWLFQDFWITSNGLVDHYFQEKSIRAEDFRPFNSLSVLLQDGVPLSCRSSERLPLVFSLSNYSGEKISGVPKITIRSRARFECQNAKTCTVNNGEVCPIACWTWTAPEVTRPEQISISIELPGSPALRNEWQTWLFPKIAAAPHTKRPIYVESGINSIPKHWSVRSFDPNTTGPLDPNGLYLVTEPTAPVIKALEQGARALVLGAETFLPAITVAYKQTWWAPGFHESANQCGTFIYPNSITDSMNKGNWCDKQWFELLEGGKKFTLDKAPCPPEQLIRALSSINSFRDQSLLFQVAIGQGMILVSGLNHTRAAGTPENEWILKMMVEHLDTTTLPKVTWPIEFLHAKDLVSVPKGTVLGVTTVRTSDRMEWQSGPSYTAPLAKIAVCRQAANNGELVWETASIKSADKPVTFIFAGGLGFASEPDRGGFTLRVNGEEALIFDLPTPKETKDRSTKVWTSKTTGIELKFEIKKTNGPQDCLGIFYLTIPANKLRPNKVQEIAVSSRGNGSRRWFGLNLYKNFKTGK